MLKTTNAISLTLICEFLKYYNKYYMSPLLMLLDIGNYQKYGRMYFAIELYLLTLQVLVNLKLVFQ